MTEIPLHELLRSTREALDVPQSEMALRMGVPLRTYCGWERGETTPIREHLIRQAVESLAREEAV
jgi:transcriptional regulator with XRE-family HTH domain